MQKTISSNIIKLQDMRKLPAHTGADNLSTCSGKCNQCKNASSSPSAKQSENK